MSAVESTVVFHPVHTHDSSREIQRAKSHYKSQSCRTVSRPRAPNRAAWEVDRTIAEHLRRPPQVAVLNVRQATSWSQDQTNELRMLQIRVASHNSLGCTIVQLLAKRNSWLKIEECPSVLDSDTLSPYVQVVCNGSNGCAFSARLQ